VLSCASRHIGITRVWAVQQQTGDILSMIALSGQRFVGVPRVSLACAKRIETLVSQADETRGERSECVNHAIKPRAGAF
jgi:hypothetical protein